MTFEAWCWLILVGALAAFVEWYKEKDDNNDDRF